ncbi:MAG: Cys-Gln thioester bond-forming surface protein [Firmicutes bacterium]|nr:Cys-Gln thioester bond-forming surface protein [Bacillota bacterium]
MAKNKQAKRMMAMAMAATLTMGMAFTAFAETETVTNPDGSTTTTTVTEGGEGTPENPEIKMTITVHHATDGSVSTTTEEVKEYTEEHENGSTETVEKETTVDEDNADGSTFDSEVNRTEVTEKDKDGDKISESYVEEGESTEIYTEEDNGSEEGQTDITVSLIPGQGTSASVDKDQVVEGDVPEGEDDAEFDYTTTDVVDRTVEAETSGVEVEITETEAEMSGLEHIFDTTAKKELYHDNGHYGFMNGSSSYTKEAEVMWENVLTEVMKARQAAIDAEDTELVEKYDAAIKKYVEGGINSILNKDGKKVKDEGGEVTSSGKNIAANFDDLMEDELMLAAINKALGGDKASEKSDADYAFVGYGDYSGQYVSKVKVTYKKDETTGEYLRDEDGDYILESFVKASNNEVITVSGVPLSAVDEEYLTTLGDTGEAQTLDKVPYIYLKKEYIKSLGGDLSGIYDQKTGVRAEHFLLMDKDGNTAYGFCIDLGTPALVNNWYKVANLEDNDYYASEEAEAHVRSIVMNGYWGTSDVAKEDGTYETGSLAKIKESLKAALKNGEVETSVLVPVKDANGAVTTQTVEITEELIDMLTNGEALDMTQAAIWSYANGMQGVTEGWNGQIIGGVMYGDHANGNRYGVTDPLGMARMKVLYNWLINLDTDEESTTVINDKNFVEDFSLTIGDKVKESDDGNSDTYEASLNFKAEFEVGENDELYVTLTYKDLEGNDVVVKKQLGVAGAEGTEDMIVPDSDNTYTLKGLALTENEEFTFDLRLEGVQQLKQGAYVYVAENGVGESQTMVSIAEGSNTVDISAKVTVKFDVNEENVVKKVRKWRDEGKIVFENGDGDDDGDDDGKEKVPPTDPTEIPEEKVPTTDVPYIDVPDIDVPMVDIATEEVPLVDIVLDEVPLTSDPSTPFMGLSFLSAIGLMFAGRRRKED